MRRFEPVKNELRNGVLCSLAKSLLPISQISEEPPEVIHINEMHEMP